MMRLVFLFVFFIYLGSASYQTYADSMEYAPSLDPDLIDENLKRMRKQYFESYSCNNYYLNRVIDSQNSFFYPLIEPKSPEVGPEQRSLLVRLLIERVDKFKLSDSTLAIAMANLDRFFDTKDGKAYSENLRDLYLAAYTSFYMAVKVSEPEVMDPDIISKLVKNQITSSEFEDMERFILKTLNWRVNPPTAFEFLYVYAAKTPIHVLNDEILEKLINAAKVHLRNALEYFDFIDEDPAVLAFAAIMLGLQDEEVTFRRHSFEQATQYFAEIFHLKSSEYWDAVKLSASLRAKDPYYQEPQIDRSSPRSVIQKAIMVNAWYP